MDIFQKLVLVMVGELILIGWLIYGLKKAGYELAEAATLVWEALLGRQPLVAAPSRKYWLSLPLLSGLWWLTIGAVVVYWLFTNGPLGNLLLGILILIHLGWVVLILQKSGYNRVFKLNDRIGFLFYQVAEETALSYASLAELDLRKKEILVLAIKRQDNYLIFPKGSESFLPQDQLIIFGDIARAKEEVFP